MHAKKNNKVFFEKMVSPTSNVTKETIEYALETANAAKARGIDTTEIQVDLATRLSMYDIEASSTVRAAPHEVASESPQAQTRATERVAIAPANSAHAPIATRTTSNGLQSAPVERTARLSHQARLDSKRREKSSTRSR